MNVLLILCAFMALCLVESEGNEIHGLRGHGREISDVVNRQNAITKRRLQEDVIITVSINFDSFPPETGWSIANAAGEVVAGEPIGTYGFTEQNVITNVTLQAGQSYNFTIEDAYGDGLCCIQPGNYMVSQGDTTHANGTGNFGSSEYTIFTTNSEVLLEDLVNTVIMTQRFPTLVAALTAAGLVDALSSGTFTVFAPSEAAFAAIPTVLRDFLFRPENVGILTEILQYHVIVGSVLSSSIVDGLEVGTLQGTNVTFSIDGGQVLINGSTIISVDLLASNGVIHDIDTVLIPEGLSLPVLTPTDSPSDAPTDVPSSSSAPSSNPTTLAPVTLPTDVPSLSSSPSSNPTTLAPVILPTDVPSSSPSSNPTTFTPVTSPTSPIPTSMPVQEPLANVVDTLNDSGNYPTLVLALLLTEVAAEIQGTGPFTFFAPSESAIALLPEGTLDFLLLPETLTVLANVLRNHVVGGTFLAADLSDGDILPSLSGGNLTISVSGSTVRVNGAAVINADILASNGVIHEIDMILLPDGISLPTITGSPSLSPSDMPAGAPSNMPSSTPTASSTPSSIPTDAPVSVPTDMPVSGPVTVSVIINFDDFPPETGWSITLTSTGEVIVNRPPLTYSALTPSITEVVTLVSGMEYNFTIVDAFGDGMCCATGGSYEVVRDSTNAILASGEGNFGPSQSTIFIA